MIAVGPGVSENQINYIGLHIDSYYSLHSFLSVNFKKSSCFILYVALASQYCNNYINFNSIRVPIYSLQHTLFLNHLYLIIRIL